MARLASVSSGRSQLAVRPEWLASHREDVIEPQQPIVDAHHHLFDRPRWRYLLEDMLADLAGGHCVEQTVYVQGRAMVRAHGPEHMRSVGETEFANGIAAMCDSGRYGPVRVCAGIVGFADLRSAGVRDVLEAHLAAGGARSGGIGRFKGIRQIAVWDPDPSLVNSAYRTTEDMLDGSDFRAGFAHLAPLGLSFDAWLLFHQIPRLTRLARAFPETSIVLDHCGGIAGSGPYEGRRDEVYAQWSSAVRELAGCQNVTVKLGGLGLGLSGFGFESMPVAPSSTVLAEAWRPYMQTLIESFGPARCMFQSNFPMDKGSYSYAVGWNAMKLIAAGASRDEKDDLFHRTAKRVYRLADEVPATDGAGGE